MSLQRECEEAVEPGDEGPESSAGASLKPETGLECRNVRFRYAESPEPVLEGINLMIPANRMTAIVGRSGAGKSTLIDLLMGLMQPESGHILVDGEEITDANRMAFRRSVGYVAQDPFPMTLVRSPSMSRLAKRISA